MIFFEEIVLFAEEKKELQLLRVLCTAIFYRLDTELFDEVLKRYPRIIEQIKKVTDERTNQNIGLFKKMDESCSYNRNYNTGN